MSHGTAASHFPVRASLGSGLRATVAEVAPIEPTVKRRRVIAGPGDPQIGKGGRAVGLGGGAAGALDHAAAARDVRGYHRTGHGDSGGILHHHDRLGPRCPNLLVQRAGGGLPADGDPGRWPGDGEFAGLRRAGRVRLSPLQVIESIPRAETRRILSCVSA